MIRVVLVDDQTLVRQGIRSLLELAGDVTIAAEAADGDEAIEVIQRQRHPPTAHRSSAGNCRAAD